MPPGPTAAGSKTTKTAVDQMEVESMSLDDFRSHQVTQKEAQEWHAHGWTIEGFEAGSGAADTNVTLACAEGHPKTLNVCWFLTRPFESEATFKCIFCADKGNVVSGFLEFKRLDYVQFYPRPGIDPKCCLGRVSKVNKKSINVMTADGKSHSVKDVKTMKRAPEPAEEIFLAKRKRSELDKLI